MKKYQFINWFPEWHGFYCFKWHKEKSDMAYIYDWFFGFAFWEIRKWHKLKDGELKHESGNPDKGVVSYQELRRKRYAKRWKKYTR